MAHRGYKPRGFGYTREIIPNHLRRVYPYEDADNNDDAISLRSIEQHPSNNYQHQHQVYSPLPHAQRNIAAKNSIPTKENPSLSSRTSIKGLFVAGGIIAALTLIIILPTVLGVVLTRNQSVNIVNISSVAPNVTTVYWSFDGNSNDMYGVYNGVLQNGAQYTNTTYFGFGSGLMLNDSTNNSIIISSPYLDLSCKSFTVEAWIYGYTLNGDSAIFSQCSCYTCQDQCLYLIIRNYKLYMGFMIDDVIGVTSLSINTWYHVAFVYDYSAQTQSVYLQGILDNSKSSAGPYKGVNASMMIGLSPLLNSVFNGVIDNLKVSTRAKSAAEVLVDATQVAYFSFDGSSLAQDMGPNAMNGTISNAAAVSGRVGQAIAFSGSPTSYLQIPGFYQLGQSNKPFTFALWVYPYSINGGTLIQLSPYANSSGWCYSLMGLNYLGQITMLVYSTGPPMIIGPVLPLRTWTHLGHTYSSTNGVQMYINGVLYVGTGAVSWLSSSAIDYLNLGSYVNVNCGPGSGAIYGVPFNGAVDEFYVYRRELSASEIMALANP